MNSKLRLFRHLWSISPTIAVKKALKSFNSGHSDSNFLNEIHLSPASDLLLDSHAQLLISSQKLLNSNFDNLWQRIIKNEFDLLGSHLHRYLYEYISPGFESFKYHGNLPEPYYSTEDRLRLHSLLFPESSDQIESSRRLIPLIDDDHLLIDWHRDIRSGYRWTPIPQHLIKFGNVPGADIKQPWELGRLQWLPSLALSATGDQINSAQRLLQNTFFDFMAFNPFPMGVQWLSPMDIGIRAANLVISVNILLRRGAVFHHSFITHFFKFLENSFLEVFNRLEWSDGMRANHYLANISSLIVILTHSEMLPEMIPLLSFLTGELIYETFYQFGTSGSNFEASTAYHCLSAELVTFPMLFLSNISSQHLIADKFSFPTSQFSRSVNLRKFINFDRPRVTFLSPIITRLQSIADLAFLLATEQFNIGDNDSGRYIVLSQFNKQQLPNEFHFLSSAVNQLRKNSNAQPTESDALPSKYRIPPNDTMAQPKPADAQPTETDSQIISNSDQSINRRFYPTSGRQFPGRNDTNPKPEDHHPTDIYQQITENPKEFEGTGLILTQNNYYRIAFRCGSVGQMGRGGHAHNDSLSFALNIIERNPASNRRQASADTNKASSFNFIVDPGSYTYTAVPELRNLYRSTAMHNTLVLPSREINAISKDYGELFWLRDRAKAAVIELRKNYIKASHIAYRRAFTREISLIAKELIINDDFPTADAKFFHFHLHPDFSVALESESKAVIARKGIEIATLSSVNLSIEDYLYSPDYGARIAAKRIVAFTRGRDTLHRIRLI